MARGAVDAVFEQLHLEGPVVRRIGDGSYLAAPLPPALVCETSKPPLTRPHFHPLVQFPTGWRTDSARRRELIDWADAAGAWIVEGNFNDELAHDRGAPEALRRIDRSDRVLAMGSFEGLFFPSLRVANLVVPKRLPPVFTAMRGLMGDHASVPTQYAPARFLDDGHMSRRLRELRSHLARQRDLTRQAIARHLPRWVQPG